jgi:DNA-binding cell septation regulator SpoVG
MLNFLEHSLDRALDLFETVPSFLLHDHVRIGRGGMFLHLPEMGVVYVGSYVDVAHRVNDSIVVDILPVVEMTITLPAPQMQESSAFNSAGRRAPGSQERRFRCIELPCRLMLFRSVADRRSCPAHP